MTPYAVSLIAVLAVAWAYHGITEHHWHRALLRIAEPRTVVPPVRHETRWHAMSHAARLAVDLGLAVAAVALGTAWKMQPAITMVTLIAAAVIAVTVIAVRKLSKSLGGRRPGNWEGN
jgi:chromate transport protein ChrA